jgi:hypothetical protein
MTIFSDIPVRLNGQKIEAGWFNALRTAGDTIASAMVAPRTENAVATGADAAVTLPATAAVRLTNASLVSVGTLAAGADGRLIFMINDTGASIDIKDSSAAVGTAANRILTGTGATLTLANNASILLWYDTADSRWRIIGGSGGGASQLFGTRASPRSIVAATGITSGASHMSTSASAQDIYVEGSVAGNSVAATITAGTIDGQVMTLIGRNDSNTVTLDDTTTNVYVNGFVTLGANQSIRLRWDTAAWVEISRSN